MTISPELLAAYADGELDADTARTVEIAVAGSEHLQAELAAHRALRAKLSAHFAPIAEQPVPDRLRQAVISDGEMSKVIDFAKRRAPTGTRRWGFVIGPALAASLVLALIGYGLRPSGSGYAQGDLAQALDGQLVATQAPDAPVRILLSVRNEQGRYCRGFTDRARSGFACHDDRGWRIIKTFDGEARSSTEYRQAGSADMAVVAAMQEMATGSALDPAEEAQAVRQGWKARQAS